MFDRMLPKKTAVAETGKQANDYQKIRIQGMGATTRGFHIISCLCSQPATE
jgi:hypothetical protein